MLFFMLVYLEATTFELFNLNALKLFDLVDTASLLCLRGLFKIG